MSIAFNNFTEPKSITKASKRCVIEKYQENFIITQQNFECKTLRQSRLLTFTASQHLKYNQFECDAFI